MKKREYCERTICIKCHKLAEHDSRYVSVWEGKVVGDVEFIRRTCKRCGYQWSESCCDSKP